MAKYKINKGFIIQKLDNKTVIFDSEESVLYTFNETASLIFKLLKKEVEEREIVNIIVKKYFVNKNQASRDVKSLINGLTKKKFIKQK